MNPTSRMPGGSPMIFRVMWAGFTVTECAALVWMAAGGVLCAVFAGLIFKTFHLQKSNV